MNTFSWGIIGPGKIANDFAEDLKHAQSANHSLGAVLSYKVEKAAQFADEKLVPKYFDSIHEFVKYAGVDAVYIATPHPLHHKETIICLENHIPVLCEKPLAMNAEQVQEMINTATASQTFLMEGMWIRFLPSIRKLLELVEKGSIGELTGVEASMSFKAPYDPESRYFKPERGGGSLLDLGIYPLYLGQLLFGPPVSVKAHAILSDQRIDEECTVSCTYSDGKTGFAVSSLINQLSNSATVKGTKGNITIPASWNETPPEIKVNYHDGNFVSYPCSWEGRGFQFEIDEVYRCVSEKVISSQYMDFQTSLNLAKTMDEVRRQTGITYPFD